MVKQESGKKLLLSAKSVSKYYTSFQALKDASLDLYAR